MPSLARNALPTQSPRPQPLPRMPRMSQQRTNRSDSARFVKNAWVMHERFPGPCLRATIHVSAAKETRMCGVDWGAHRAALRGALIEIGIYRVS